MRGGNAAAGVSSRFMRDSTAKREWEAPRIERIDQVESTAGGDVSFASETVMYTLTYFTYGTIS